MEFFKTNNTKQIVDINTGELTDVSLRMNSLELENQRLMELLKKEDELSSDTKFGRELAKDTKKWYEYFGISKY
jgi:cell shape-determining protein MreC